MFEVFTPDSIWENYLLTILAHTHQKRYVVPFVTVYVEENNAGAFETIFYLGIAGIVLFEAIFGFPYKTVVFMFIGAVMVIFAVYKITRDKNSEAAQNRA
ncbi:hypothetical protein [Natrinema salaciae]|uniref:hypothetical protein n=1 Tax=Natrinema salaciae TaxID=1186196 RepID=UPI001587C0FB|nr:hypothetical protein [Natrinema salaciae]